MEVFRSVAGKPATPRYWRARAGVLLAQSLQRLGKGAEALEACGDVVDSTRGVVEPIPTRELIWIYRAGFLAVEILEGQKQWDAAAKMADRLSQTNGSGQKKRNCEPTASAWNISSGTSSGWSGRKNGSVE